MSARAGVKSSVALSVLAALVLLGLGAGAARASCDTWTGATSTDWFTASNWSGGVPTSSTVACIPDGSSTVLIEGDIEASNSAAAASTLSVGAGDTLELEGFDASGTPDAATLTLSSGGTVASGGEILMTAGCAPASCTGGASSTLNIMSGTLINGGTITANDGTESTPSGRTILGSIDSQGRINVDAPISVPGGSSRITNDTGGLITNNGSTSSLTMGPATTFDQGAGTTSPDTANPAHPAVVIDNPTNAPSHPTLTYSGSGASAIAAQDEVNLSGNVAAGQNLVIDSHAGCAGQTQVTAASGFTNGGTITLAGSCASGLFLTTGTLTNTGTLTAAAGSNREISGSLSNSGVLEINGGTAFDKSGATLTQTRGITTIANGTIFDTSGSNATFQLQGGVLTGGGQSQSTAADINGPVDNSGGNIIPGSATKPGLLNLGGSYTQGSRGRLTEVVDGPGGSSEQGKHYSDVSANGSLSLAGTLAIHALGTPSVNDFDTVVATNGSRSGSFSTVTGAFTPGSPFGYKAAYGSNYAALEVGAALKVTRAGPGTGTVTSSPSGINCGTQCDTPFFQDATVTLTAHPGTGSALVRWSGGCTGSSTTCHVKMNQARTVTATFGHATTTSQTSSLNPAKVGKKVTYTATVTPHPTGGTVKFTSGGSTISGCGSVAVNTSTGKATCSVTYHSTGSRRIRAAYSGNSTFGHSTSATLTERVT
jgi:hypothetical protein